LIARQQMISNIYLVQKIKDEAERVIKKIQLRGKIYCVKQIFQQKLPTINTSYYFFMELHTYNQGCQNRDFIPTHFV
jgi:hypothetical protein